MLNSVKAELYDLIVDINPDFYMSNTAQSITVVSGTAAYDVPDTYYKTVSVDVLSDSGYYVNMKKFNRGERNRYSVLSTDKSRAMWRISNLKLVISPTPTWGGTIKHMYIPQDTKFTQTTDTYDGISGWEEYLILGCLIFAAGKEQSDPSLFIAQKNSLEQRIRSWARDLDFGEPDMVRDAWSESTGYIYP
jgi:hypothetical protein